MDLISTKIEFVRAITRQVHDNFTGQECYAQSVDTFLEVLNVYGAFLVGQKENLPVYRKNAELWTETIADCRFLLDELIENEWEDMVDWSHGQLAQNMPQAIAGFLTRVLMELIAAVGKYRDDQKTT